MKPVIRITKKATQHLKEVLASRSENSDQRLRLVASPAGTGLVLDKACREDKVIEVDGVPVLLLDPLLVPVLKGATLDFRDFSEGPCLTLVK